MTEKMIPFSGAGKYRLANGQIVSLNQSRRCSPSDKVQANTGLCLDWIWENDGSITGLGPTSKLLYLVEKLPEVKYYINKKGFLDNTAYIIRTGCVYQTMRKDGTLGVSSGWQRTNDQFVENGNWLEVTEGAARKSLDAKASEKENVKPVEPDTNVKGDFMFIKKEEVAVEKETVIKIVTGVAKFVGKWGWRTVNYWGFQPVTEIATRILRAVRYVTLTGAIVGGVYAYNNPEKAADLFKSCLPKITIESPEIMKS